MSYPSQNVNLDKMFDKFGEQSASSSAELENMAQTLDAGNPKDLIMFQHKMNIWSIQQELQSTVIKILRDVCRSIVQKTG